MKTADLIMFPNVRKAAPSIASLTPSRAAVIITEALKPTPAPVVELSVDAEQAIDAAAQEDLSFLLDAVSTVDEDGKSLPPLNLAELARALWEISRWDLPVHVRCELARVGHDAGWNRYAVGMWIAR